MVTNSKTTYKNDDVFSILNIASYI